jgi:hypothetical protein
MLIRIDHSLSKVIVNKRLNIQALLVSLFFCGSLFSQTHPFLNKFIATRIGETVYLTWNIKAGSTCDGIQVFRSTDSLNFYKIGEIPGVCGDVFESRSYTYTDFIPEKNRVNYYKIGLNENGFSQIITIDLISFNNKGYQVRPNPMVHESLIKFENSNKQWSELCVYSLNGSRVLQLQTSTDFFEVYSSGLLPGYYTFTISSKTLIPAIVGKFVVSSTNR